MRPDAKVYLFGSRVRDDLKGGDIDILILSNPKLNWDEKHEIRMDFYSKFGEQKIDLLSFTYNEDHPMRRIAIKEGVLL